MKQIAWDEVMKRLEVASKICNDASPVQVEGPIHVGVDLGTADVVVMAVDDNGMPVSAFLEWATVVRDGVVVDYHGAITIVKRLVSMTEERLGRKITGRPLPTRPERMRGFPQTFWTPPTCAL